LDVSSEPALGDDPIPSERSADGRAPDVCSRVVPDAAFDDEWDSLALATHAAPFVRPGWIRAWMAAFAPRRQLQVIAVRRDGQLVAVLPVLVTRRGAAAPTNSETPVMEPLALDDEALRALVPGLLAGGWRADLRFLPNDGHTQALVTGAGADGLTTRCELIRRSPYTRVEGDWDEFLRSALSSRRRRTLRRHEEKLAAQGRVDFEVYDGRNDLSALLTEGFRVELGGWKGRERTAVLSRRQTERFYRSAAEWAAQAGLLRLTFLRLDGRPVAFNYSLEQFGVTYFIKIVFDEEFREYGPGLQLIHRLLQRAFDSDDLRLFEWLGEDDQYKVELSSGIRDQVRLQLFSRSAAGAIDRGLATAVSAARAEARRRLTPDTRRRIVVTLNKLRPPLGPRARSPQDDARK
jgi:CelD/BcsL family acetyltransferase involved in cellulose biosynthesis